jgi:hypothetical protein
MGDALAHLGAANGAQAGLRERSAGLLAARMLFDVRHGTVSRPENARLVPAAKFILGL